jgi:DNA invertase Pin-like site-specific DNA recombinase
MTVNSTIPVAQYLRMSTEHQQYSTDNQARRILQYAQTHGLEITRTYSDCAKSGLWLKNRPGLRELLQDVTAGNTAYKAILVYDVSRWGRFQDTDEAAHYEFLCKSAGIPVHYCAETFANDGSLPSSIMKALKRAMAGEYSRELGVKVLDGQKRLAKLGFKQGGVPGYGLRRLLVSADRQPKQPLSNGQRKSIATDRVILVPGPVHEVECVRKIYEMFVRDGLSVAGIVRELNRRGVPYCNDKEWSHCNVMAILTHPKYVGSQVFNRASSRLGGRKVRNPRAEWIVTAGACERIIDEATFTEAQRIIANFTIHLSDEQMLKDLRALLDSEGRLSLDIIDKSRGVPCAAAYRNRFGSLPEAYELIGYHGRPTVATLHNSRRIRTLRDDLLCKICEMFPDQVRIVQPDVRRRARLRMKSGFTVSVLISRFERCRNRWRVSFAAGECGLVTLLARLDKQNKDFMDFHVFKRMPRATNSFIKLESALMSKGVKLPDLSYFRDVVREVHAR